MSAATVVEVIVCVIPLVGLIVTCIVDPANLVDRKYGNRVDSK